MVKTQIDITLAQGDLTNQFAFEFTVESASVVTLYGPSGEGKTTLLRALAGLIHPHSGSIIYADETWFDSNQQVAKTPQERGVGMVFQDHRLFPNMTVDQNLKFALNAKDDQFVQELIDLFQLNGLLDLYPPSLSGGQRQRVAIAQSLVQKPRVLLLDEPMSALDEETRKQIQEVILAVHKRLKMTVFMVSHDLNETLTMSDYVLLIKNGTVLKSGTPLAVFSNGLNTKLEGKIIDLAFLHDRVVLKVIVGDNIVSIERPFANKEEYMIGQSLTLEIA